MTKPAWGYDPYKEKQGTKRAKKSARFWVVSNQTERFERCLEPPAKVNSKLASSDGGGYESSASMRNLFKSLFLLATCLPLFAAAPYEYSPVFTNLTLISTPGLANRVTSLVGGGVVTNLYTGVLNGLGGTFIWDPDGPIASWDGIDVLDKRIPSPTNETHTPGAGTLATGTYYYRVSAVTTTPAGETVPSTETSLAVTGPVGINVNWTQIPGATGYKVYGRATGAELLIAQVGKVGTYLDTGALTPSGAMPATNSTMGVIGTWNRHFIKVFGKAPQSGDLTNNFPNLVLVPIITAAGPIGSATTTPVITFDAKGRLTTVTSATITGTAPGGAAGGGLVGLFPNPGIDLSTGTNIIGDLPFSNIVQIANNSLLGNFTGATADIQVLTSITSANLAQILSNETGTGLVVFSDSPTFTTQITTPSAIFTSLTPTRVVFVGGSDELVDDADMTFVTDTLSVTKLVAPSSVSTPAVITAAGPLTVTPAAGSGVDIVMTTADLDVRSTATVMMTVGASGAQATSRVLIDGSPSSSTGRAQLSINAKSGVASSVLFEQAGTDIWLIGAGAASDGTNFEMFAAQTGAIHTFKTDGVVGINSATPLATLSVNGSGHIGGDSDPGDNNLLVDGLTTTATLSVATSAYFDYATDNRVAAFTGGKFLTASTITTTELGHLSGVTSSIQNQLNARVREPQEGTGDPNFLGLTGDDNGQMYVNTTTGEKWTWYATGSFWLP